MLSAAVLPATQTCPLRLHPHQHCHPHCHQHRRHHPVPSVVVHVQMLLNIMIICVTLL